MTTFPLSILAIDREIFLGKAASLTLPTSQGQIQVLAGHAPLITFLQEGDVFIEKEDRASEKLPIAGGVLHVKGDMVMLLVNF
ncbi:MAG: hypothetical protein HY458_00380 [Parcubacteria group bacterium]|nr:hypothetical protein [Parcubacteria group bacterium]